MTKPKKSEVRRNLEFHEDDRSVELGLRPNGAGPQRVVHLAEPSVLEMIDLQTKLDRLDDKLPPVHQAVNPREPTGDELTLIADSIKEQNRWVYGKEAPYANALIDVIKMCSGEEVTLAELPSWALSPGTCRQIMLHFKTPLAGPADLAAMTRDSE